MKIAVLFANRGFFPSEVIEAAQREMSAALEGAGLTPLLLPAGATKYGAVETTDDGVVFRQFLEAHRGAYDGMIICLPNFGDENGIKAAIRDMDVPILLQAYPDEIGAMDFARRRDAFCGKLALTSVLKQMGKEFTQYKPFVVHPSSDAFAGQLGRFAAVCRVVKRMRHMRIGAVGARTTAFKSVRYDEMTLERHGVDVECYDLIELFARMDSYSPEDAKVREWLNRLDAAADCSAIPAGREVELGRLGAALNDMVLENGLDALALRCWSELQTSRGIAPCGILGLLNHEGIPAVCEADVSNVLAMTALATAAQGASGCLDWNNNFGDDPDACILFHCGPLPPALMRGRGVIESHKMLDKSFGPGCSWGLNVGSMAPGAVTFMSMRTEGGELQFYTGAGVIEDRELEAGYFGTPGVLRVPGLQDVMMNISDAGFRHHVAVAHGDVGDAVAEALGKYLGYRRVAV